MGNDPLVDYCNTDIQTAHKIIGVYYWTAETYSFGKHIREYGFYPSFLPLCVYTDHGAGTIDKPFKHELESDAPCQLYHSPDSVREWAKFSAKPCHVLYSPFVFYRKNRHIEQVPSAKGTIAFPAHSTPSIDDVSDIEIYIKQLLTLPEQFQPVSVCLHMHDINKGRHKVFEKHGIPVHTAGNAEDDRFAERFYDIIKNFRYATSNMVGSYLYYCVEMGMPFSIYGEKQQFINREDTNIVSGEYDPYKLFESCRVAHDLFSGLYTDITEEQKKFVETHLGLYDGVGRIKMAIILYTSLVTWLYRNKFIQKKLLQKFKALFG